MSPITRVTGSRLKQQVRNMNAYAERWVLSARTEQLDHFVFCGERLVQQVLAEYLRYYNELRRGYASRIERKPASC